MKYRKKPVVIDAMLWDGSIESADAIEDWSNKRTACYASTDLKSMVLEIDTLEGRMTALPGDWIIKGVKGEFYPCKPDIFAITYDKVEDDVT